MRCLPRAMPITQAAARENKLATEGVSVGLCNIPMAAHVAHTWSDNDYCIKRAIVSTGTIRGVFCWKAFTFLGKLEESTTRRSRCKYCSLLFRLNTRKRLQSEEPPLLQKSAADSQRFASSLSMWSIKKRSIYSKSSKRAYCIATVLDQKYRARKCTWRKVAHSFAGTCLCPNKDSGCSRFFRQYFRSALRRKTRDRDTESFLLDL